MEKLTEDEINMIKYFWEEKRYLRRYCSFEKITPKIESQFPEILKAWRDYSESIKRLNDLISKLDYAD